MLNRLRFTLSILFLLLISVYANAQVDSTNVILRFDTDESFLVIDQDYSNCIPVNPKEIVAIESGKRNLTIASKYHYDAVVSPTLKPGVTHTIMFKQERIKNLNKNAHQSSYTACKLKSNVFFFADHDARVSINGQNINETSFHTTLNNGTYKVTTTVGGVKEVSEMNINGYTVFENYVRPTRMELFKKSFIPGAAQFRKHEKLKGALVISLMSGFGISSVLSNFKLAQKNSKYEKLRLEYQFATDPREVLTIAKKADKTYDQILKFERYRNASIIAFSATYLLNIIDGITAPKFGLTNDKIIMKPFIDFDSDLIPKAKIEIDF
ncbi:DUF5683 domain-containing protein [Gracilimonas sp. BCB1]|uniref:DUF5683 domain-containing protein n=1 Tax=Gracilimonas sp. BCB1 TaxID=3152362 RepID=UPI0032D938FA